MQEWLIVFIIVSFGIGIIKERINQRGFFWLDKDGNKLSFKEFMLRWKRGVEGITPVQSTRTNLWSMIPIFAGIIWGIVITIISKTYWLCLVLLGSLPITTIQFINTWQRYKVQKKVQDTMKELENDKIQNNN